MKLAGVEVVILICLGFMWGWYSCLSHMNQHPCPKLSDIQVQEIDRAWAAGEALGLHECRGN